MKSFNLKKATMYSLIGATLCSCLATGPVYKTSDTFIPPESTEGEKCANECLVRKQECQAICYGNDTEQLSKVVINVLGTEDNKEQTRHEEFLERIEREEERKFKRNKYKECQSSCNENHKLCHTHCGGKIVTNTTCIRNCKSETT